MEQRTLEAILEIESEIRQQLTAEQERAEQWLERARLDVERRRLADLAQIEESVKNLEETAAKTAGEKAAEIIRHATEIVGRIDRYDDTHLMRIVREHIATIAPEACRDR